MHFCIAPVVTMAIAALIVRLRILCVYLRLGFCLLAFLLSPCPPSSRPILGVENGDQIPCVTDGRPWHPGAPVLGVAHGVVFVHGQIVIGHGVLHLYTQGREECARLHAFIQLRKLGMLGKALLIAYQISPIQQTGTPWVIKHRLRG